MRTTARLLTGTALAAAVLGMTTVGVTTASAGDFEALEIYPSTAAPGESVTVNTRACGHEGGVGDADSLHAGRFDMEPGTHKESVVGTFQVPHDAKPGQYDITVLCDNGKEAKGDLAVKATAPMGHVKTGVGGSIGPDSTQIAAGVAVLAAAAVGGSWLLRRRASGAQSS